jgi:hypothetical protein
VGTPYYSSPELKYDIELVVSWEKANKEILILLQYHEITMGFIFSNSIKYFLN